MHDGVESTATLKYDVVSNSWIGVIEMTLPRGRQTFGAAVVLGSLYVAGGSASSPYVVDVFDGTTWRMLRSLYRLPDSCVALAYFNMLALMGESHVDNTTHLYDPQDNNADYWSKAIPPFLEPRMYYVSF